MMKEKPTIAELEAILNSPDGPSVWIRPDGSVTTRDPDIPEIPWPDPTPGMLKGDPLFDAIWKTIKAWDINVPGAYSGYCGATGNHARAIYDAITALPYAKPVETP